MIGGYIKLWRSLLDSQIMTDDWLCRLAIWCLLRANYLPGNFKGQIILPGQFITGRISGAAELNVSPSKWYRGIERLIDVGFIEYEANSSWTTLTIVNWSTYQDEEHQARAASEQQTDSQRTADDTTNGQPADTIEERKKVRKEEGKKGIPSAAKKAKKLEPIAQIPNSLKSPEFADAWERWQAHRREIKKALTPTQATAQLQQFALWGIDKSITAINYTIMKGWQGLAEPDLPNRAGKPLTPDLFSGLREFGEEMRRRDEQQDNPDVA